MVDLVDLLDVLELEEVATGRFLARNVTSTLPTTLGSQTLAQAVVAAERTVPHMAVQSLHGVFPRGGYADRAVDVEVEVVQSGRSLATAQVTFRQDGREHARVLTMLSVDEPDFLAHHAALPADVPGPEDCADLPCALLPWEVRTFGGADALALDFAGPPSLDVWMRCDKAPDLPMLSRALLAHGSEGFLGPVTLRPYPQAEIARRGGRGRSAMLAQTVTFHRPFTVHNWLLLRCESPFAGAGRMYSRIQIFTRAGELVASADAQGLMRAEGPAAQA
ncbi:acyl-CoA thioesterase II [Nocardia neocaledoniensis NBRC 108232]|uniref:Acyl-CoA thioesterase-2 n=1 Tax=Nocardia neocaledoniensis TaxID=236511 RepID=A0A317N9H8_9NOCA|nr:acyl-CoA thioesterase domain-containing protein [Nocardia neocaledoniensis]PWV71769.1 acyl-CoA thioesterase-2 [Nocardia neocaledoniensis]GEM33059.1 acyl-CoA thioesterase II [Nocardia neocaledoniensis NBRC 108232]